ncbi:MAG: GTP cyclohydrolase II RibA [Sphingobacteriales bacterium]|nr:MAG: GTP cyclohydrolase II RibA [Sphingobacteriales bacterium]
MDSNEEILCQERGNPVVILEKVNIPIGKNNIVGTFMSFDGLIDGKEHFAVAFGELDSIAVPLIRIHSECITGDVFGSLRCDCGPQLDEAIEKINNHGGLLIYLRQEGRGIGLYNKFSAYRLQDLGLNTYEANEKIGFDRDLREYVVAADIIRSFNFKKIKLLTNNLEKIKQLESQNIHVEQIHTSVFANPHNFKYLRAKNESKLHTIALIDSDEFTTII